MAKEVVITGMSLITSLGLSLEENWKNIVAGKSGVKNITLQYNIGRGGSHDLVVMAVCILSSLRASKCLDTLLILEKAANW